MKRIFAWPVMACLLAGCASSGSRAPVVARSAADGKNAAIISQAAKKDSTDMDWRPKVHVVQKGDTLYAIAFNYGLDPRELAELNNIQDVNLIQIGQQIRLLPGSARGAAEGKSAQLPLQAQSAASHQPVTQAQPMVKEQPKVVKYPYSEAAVAQAEAVQAAQDAARSAPVTARAEIKAKTEPIPDAKPEIRPDTKPDHKVEPAAEHGGEDALEWSMPAQGKLVGSFSEADNRKGIDIAGKLGQPIFASAPGKVVYSGSGLRGYGKLLIIKHNKSYLSAYAHNDQLLVKEGETVTRGQKIAEMGNSDSDGVKLHFEVRRLGKPVDPANYLSLGKP